MNRGECRRFFECCQREGVDRRLLCETLYFTGCRISEALALTGDDIDLNASTIQIRCLKKRGKTVIRRVPVPLRLCSSLKKLSGGPSQRCWSVCRTTAWRTVKRVMKEAGIEGIHATAKGLRHGFGVRGALGKIPVNVIQRWMGHSDSETTAIYLEVMDDEERELIKRTW